VILCEKFTNCIKEFFFIEELNAAAHWRKKNWGNSIVSINFRQTDVNTYKYFAFFENSNWNNIKSKTKEIIIILWSYKDQTESAGIEFYT
jgi:hypothetical protein